MSLFIDVTETLSNALKSHFIRIIEKGQKDQDRPIRKICDTCIKYLDYGELRYDKMEDGISRLQEMDVPGNPLYILLLAILQESLDEDQLAIRHLGEFSDTGAAASFQQELTDFITIGRFMTLKEYDLLEDAGSIMIDRYTGENDITDTLSNLYLKAEDARYLEIFERLLARAKEHHPSLIALESLTGFIRMKAQDYPKALESFLVIKERLEQDRENPYYQYNLANTWDNLAGCYLKLGDAAKSLECCETALNHDSRSEEYKVGFSILYKKAEALLMLGDKEQARAIADHILQENEEDEQALEIKKRIL